jgi:hypothetical protein
MNANQIISRNMRIWVNEYQSRELMGIPGILATPTLGRDDVTLIRAAFLSTFNSSFKAGQPTVNRLQNYRNRYLDKKKECRYFSVQKHRRERSDVIALNRDVVSCRRNYCCQPLGNWEDILIYWWMKGRNRESRDHIACHREWNSAQRRNRYHSVEWLHCK